MRIVMVLVVSLLLLSASASRAEEKADSIVEAGFEAYKSGDFDTALKRFVEAREAYRKERRRDGEALMLYAMGAVYKNQEKWVECIEALQGCRDLRRELGDREGETKVLDGLCSVYRALADYYGTQKNPPVESGYRMMLADSLASLERWADAEGEARKAVALRRASGARVPMAVSQAQLALYVSHQGKHAEAIACDLEAIEVFRQTGDRAGEAATSTNLGDEYAETGRLEAAVGAYQQARDLHRALGRTDRELVNTISLGDTLYAAGRWDASIETWREAVSLAKRLRQPSREASALSSLGYVLDQRGRRGEAEKTLRQALQLAESVKDSEVAITALVNLGAVLNHTGRKEEALRTFRDACERARAISDHVKAGIALSNMGEIHMQLQMFPQALLDMDQALAVFRVAKSERHELITLINIGALHDATGERDKARAIYADAQGRLRKAGMKSELASVLNNLAALEGAAGSPAKALPLYLESLAILEELGREDAAGVTLRNIGFVQSDMGRLDDARGSLQRAIDRLHKAGNRDAEGLSCYDLGRLEYEAGHHADALARLAQAMSMLESLATGYRVSELKAAYLSTAAARYAFTVAAFYQQRRLEEAFQLAERAKARAFLDSLSGTRVDLRKGVPPPLLDRERELRARIDALRADKGGYAELNRLSDEYGRLMAEIALVAPESASLRTAQVASLKELRQALAPDEVLIAFFVGEKRTYAWALRADGTLEAADFAGGDARVKGEVEDLRGDLRDPRGHGPIAPVGTVAELVRFMEAHASGAKRLVVVGHRSLHYLPFGPLADSKGGFMADRWAIVSVPSASAWYWLRQRPARGAGGGLVAYALGTATPGGTAGERGGLGPLPATRKEVTEVAGLFGASSSSVFSDGQCVLSNLSKRVKGARYLHFATHGLLDARQPALSALAMADGFLTVTDILGLDLEASLVTLSACDTAGGRLTAGDEVVGLTRAFLHAGARTVVASLWKVPDASTAALMEAFYRALHTGASPADALRAAQAEVRKTWPSPLYWGAFVVYGDGRL